jgi:hypothetical protein
MLALSREKQREIAFICILDPDFTNAPDANLDNYEDKGKGGVNITTI